MRDISARELKGHNILAVERFRDNTRWMIEFSVRAPAPTAAPAMRFACFSPRMATGRPWTPSAASRSRSSGMPTL